MLLPATANNPPTSRSGCRSCITPGEADKICIPGAYTVLPDVSRAPVTVAVAQQETYLDLVGSPANGIQPGSCNIVGISNIKGIAYIYPDHCCKPILHSITAPGPK